MIKLAELIGKCNECGRDWNHGHDHEASMAKNELRDMISNASKIDQMVKEGDNLPGWISAYISLAADYMHSVSEYLAGESSRMEEPGPGYGDMMNEGIELAKIQAADAALHNLMRNISTNSNIPTAEKQGLLQALKELQDFVDEVGYDAEMELDEKKKPSAGLTKKQKSAVAKKARAGKDIGKKGPGFEKVAKAAEKKYGSKEAGERVAAAAMWKSVKR